MSANCSLLSSRYVLARYSRPVLKFRLFNCLHATLVLTHVLAYVQNTASEALFWTHNLKYNSSFNSKFRFSYILSRNLSYGLDQVDPVISYLYKDELFV